jgi:tRNA pseudouridine65 synthase
MQKCTLFRIKNQIGGQHVYPIHRLDRKTSEFCYCALNKEILKIMNDRFAAREVKKIFSDFSGWAQLELTIDYDLTNDNDIKQKCDITFSAYKIQKSLEFNNKPTSRYCLVEAIPETGHASITETFQTYISSHLGSRPHGCNKQNKLWLENYDLKE